MLVVSVKWNSGCGSDIIGRVKSMKTVIPYVVTEKQTTEWLGRHMTKNISAYALFFVLSLKKYCFLIQLFYSRRKWVVI